MRLLRKLLGYLNRPFDKDPEDFLALRLRYDGGMTWEIADCVLTTSVAGGTGANISVDLKQYTITQLAAFLATLPGYSVVFVDPTDNATRSARCLLDGTGDIDKSNGDHLRGYTSDLFAYLDAQASELTTARVQIVEMIEQMSTRTADGEWLDELGSYYAVPRAQGEPDSQYGPRIIASVLMPRGNNIAIAVAIEQITGGISARITDAVDVAVIENRHNGAILRNGTFRYQSGGAQFANGLFDAEFNLDFASDAFDAARILALIEMFRDAGTHLRRISLSGSMQDAVSRQPVDYTRIAASFDATGSIAVAQALAPAGSATAAVNVSAAIGTATASAPAGTAEALTAGQGKGQVGAVTVRAPNATARAGGNFSAPAATATTSAPTATVTIIPEEFANVAIAGWMEAYVSAVARVRDGSIVRDGTEIYDNGEETFEVNIIGP